MTYAKAPSGRILVPTFQTIELVEIKDIVFIKAFENYSRLYLTKGRKFTSTQSFGKFVGMLKNRSYYQCHKSYVVNLEHIVRYYKNGEIELPDGMRIPVARRRKEEFLELLTLQLTVS